MPYIIATIIVIILGIGFTLFQTKQAEVPTPVAQEVTTPTIQPTDTETTTTTYKDGVFKTQTTYQTPVRSEYKLDVSLTLDKGIITDSAIAYSQGAEKDPNAQRFEAAYKTEVIGKNIDDLNLSRVGGASLTTGAFNNALISIKTSAKS